MSTTLTKIFDRPRRSGYTYDSFDFTKKFQTWDYTSGLKNDVWMFNLTGSSWSLLEPSSGDTRPTARAFHAASYSSGMLYVHGGNDYLLGNNERGGTSFMKLCGLDDLWSFDVSTRAWVKIHDFEGTCSGVSSAHTSKQTACWAVLIIAFIACFLTVL